MALTRRTFLAGSLGAGALAGVSACGSDDDGPPSTDAGGSSPAGGGEKSSIGPVTGTLDFSFWGGSPGETKGFTYAKTEFEKANPGTTVNLKIVPYDGFFSGIDRGLQAGNAPDIFRVDYTNLGKYSSNNALMDVSPYYTAAEIDEFLPAFWGAVLFEGRPYGVPHQTDTTAIVYDTDVFAAAGITPPTTLDTAWTWEQFGEVAAQLRSSLPADKFPFAFNWTQAGAFRWLNWLHQAGGTLLNEDLSESVVPSEAATKALDFTKSFFDQKWVPATNTVKGAKYSDEFFNAKTVPMSFVADFSIPYLADPKTGYKGDWAVTYMPRDAEAASDLGGNAIVANADTENPDLAAAFLKFVASEEQMKYFCEQSIELPTRRSLAESDLEFVIRPEIVSIYAEQATTVSDTLVKESTVPAFNQINTLLQDQLEAAFKGQETDETLQRIGDGVNEALSS